MFIFAYISLDVPRTVPQAGVALLCAVGQAMGGHKFYVKELLHAVY